MTPSFASGHHRYTCKHRMLVVCSTGKGFGASTAGKKAGSKQVKPRVLEEVVKEAKNLGKAVPPNWQPARPVDQREAKRGRVDFVQVRDWGSGKPEDLGQLQVAEGDTSPTISNSAASGLVGQQGQASSVDSASVPQQQSIFQQLAGAAGSPLIRKRMRKLPEVPPYEEWQLTTTRYQQYLANLCAVHQALEGALATAASCPPEAPGPSGRQLSEALAPLGASCPLARAVHLQSDLDAISRSQAAAASQTSSSGAAGGAEGELLKAEGRGSRGRGPKGGQLSGTSDSGGGAASGETASSSTTAKTGGSEGGAQAQEYAVAYARYLQQLARSWRAADTTEEQLELVGRLLAHAFAIHVSYASLATRVGAAATEKLGLFQVGAVAAYKEYPAAVVDHLSGLQTALDEVEGGLGSAELQFGATEAAIGEMPRALEECAMMVLVLAAA